jgi:ribosomal protein S18 acetylase RimI-like enzyme
MAGERMRFPESRGEQPFLHAWKSNHAAISLYEGLGFKILTEVNVSVLTRGAARVS